MKILNLSVRNFKGIKNLAIDTAGGDLDIFGDNATGKTTVFDAFLWLLFGKDSQNKQMDDQIKFRDSTGTVDDQGVDHEVEGTFEVDGHKLNLKKVFSETWTKKRGSATATFTGHTTDYFIDGVPVKKKEYDSRIGDIADEGIFKLLTNPLYFNEQLHWQERRKLLLEVCGDIEDAEVIDQAVTVGNKDMLQLLTVLNSGRTLDDHRKVIRSKQATINKELKEIPARVDEVQRGLPDTNGLFNPETLEVEVKSIEKQKRDVQSQIVRVENGGEIADREKALREVESRIISILNKHRESQSDKTYQKRLQLNDLKSEAQVLQGTIKTDKQRASELNETAESITRQMEALRGSWFEKNERQFTFEQSDTCPTCGQKLPADQLEAAREKAQASFNATKSAALEKINADGKKLKEQLETAAGKISDLNNSILANESKLQTLNEKIGALQTEIENTPAAPDLSENADYQAAVKDKESIQGQIDSLKSESAAVIRKLQSESGMLDQDIMARQKKIAAIEQRKDGEKRITELKAEEEKLAAEYEKLEGELFLTEEFIRTKVNMLDERINSKFKFARFKLFNQQINGGLEECCETLGNGVPYSAGLNNAARINVGLDIINTLSAFYEFEAPIFIDNSEAITKLAKVNAQVIRLVVSEPDKSLRVEHQNSKEAI